MILMQEKVKTFSWPNFENYFSFFHEVQLRKGRNIDTNKHPLINPTDITYKAGTGIARPKNDNWWTITYRYFFFFINALFVAFGLFLVGFGLYGIARLAYDGVSNPIVVTSGKF